MPNISWGSFLKGLAQGMEDARKRKEEEQRWEKEFGLKERALGLKEQPDVMKNILSMFAGVKTPEAVFGEEKAKEIAPMGRTIFETPQERVVSGSGGGMIRGMATEIEEPQIGEIPQVLMQKIAENFGISPEEIRRQAVKKTWGISVPKGVWSKSGLTNLARNKILGVLQTGYYTHPLTPNIRMHLRTKEDAIKFLQQQGYMNYEEDPDIVEIINKLPSETETQKTTQKKGWFLGGQKTTKTTEQRFNELVTSGFTEEQAYRQLIKEGY